MGLERGLGRGDDGRLGNLRGGSRDGRGRRRRSLVRVVGRRQTLLEHAEVLGNLDGPEGDRVVGLTTDGVGGLGHGGLGLGREVRAAANAGVVENRVDVGSLRGLEDHEPLDHLLHVSAVHLGQRGDLSLHNLEPELLHAPRLEGHGEGAHLEQDASECPDVRVEGVRPVPPNLRGHVVRGANLGVGHVVLHQLRDAEVPELDNLAGHAQHVRRLHVAVKDLLRVERLEAPGNLDEVGPDEVLGEKLALSLALAQRPGEITEGSVLHDDAQAVAVDERLVEAADGRVLLNRREQANLVDRILALLLGEVAHVRLLQRVDLVVAQTADAIPEAWERNG